ncbi:unnamed protein product, partial [Prorocentrum cordatum]
MPLRCGPPPALRAGAERSGVALPTEGALRGTWGWGASKSGTSGVPARRSSGGCGALAQMTFHHLPALAQEQTRRAAPSCKRRQPLAACGGTLRAATRPWSCSCKPLLADRGADSLAAAAAVPAPAAVGQRPPGDATTGAAIVLASAPRAELGDSAGGPPPAPQAAPYCRCGDGCPWHALGRCRFAHLPASRPMSAGPSLLGARALPQGSRGWGLRQLFADWACQCQCETVIVHDPCLTAVRRSPDVHSAWFFWGDESFEAMMASAGLGSVTDVALLEELISVLDAA